MQMYGQGEHWSHSLLPIELGHNLLIKTLKNSKILLDK